MSSRIELLVEEQLLFQEIRLKDLGSGVDLGGVALGKRLPKGSSSTLVEVEGAHSFSGTCEKKQYLGY
ncbi:hypothetical protein Tco_0183754 [Tanacetum coccineum]